VVDRLVVSARDSGTVAATPQNHPEDNRMAARFTSFALYLLATAAAAPASAWTLLVDIDREGNGNSGPTEIAGTLYPNQNKTVGVSFGSNYAPPPNPVIPPRPLPRRRAARRRGRAGA
jgi:hypothetical protein